MASLSEDELLNSAETEILSHAAVYPSPARAHGLFGQSLANMALRGASMAFRFLLMICLAHYLSASDVGIFVLVYASTSLGILLLGARFDVYSTRAICSGEKNAAAIIRDQMIFHLLLYAIVLPLMLLLFAVHLPGAPPLLPWNLALWFYVLLVLEHSGQECNRLFVALGQPLRATFVFFLRSGAWAALVLPLMFFRHDLRNLQTVWVLWTAGGVACLVWSAYWMRRLGWRSASREKVDWGWIKRGLRPSASYTVALGAVQLITTVDRYFLKATWASDYVGVYGFYSNLTNFVPTFAETGIVSIVLPQLLSSASSRDWKRYGDTMGKLTRGVWVIVGAASLLSIPLVFVVLMLVKRQPIYSAFLPAFAILMVSEVIFTLNNIPHNALYANHKDRQILNWSVVSLVAAVVCYAALAPKYGIYGICVGSIVSSAVVLGGKWWDAWKLRISSV